MNRPFLCTIALLFVAGACTATHADFSGDYSLNPPANGSQSWSPAGNDRTFTEAVGQWTLNYQENHFIQIQLTTNGPTSFTLQSGAPAGTPDTTAKLDMSLSVTIATSGYLNFSYVLTSTDQPGDSGNYSINGVATPFVLTGVPNGTTGPFPAEIIRGTISGIPVEAGDILAFDIKAGPDKTEPSITQLMISDFSVVPEPSTALFGLFAALGAGMLRRRAPLSEAAV